ncbi:MAG: ABC transporter ATP-binding protein [Caldilineaceae bacterium]|nr:ABC transporter ATP-binding protein [Caldilineaceae bacterium]MCB0140408.1 ABC transporter ATP-binding protein [Caldilineaceae bacterium]
MSRRVLEVKDLQVHYRTPRGPVKAVDGISFELAAGERLGIVGESGSGKSTMALALMRMLPTSGQIVGGQMLLDNVDLAPLSEEQMRRMRLDQLSMIPQGAMNSLNPVMRIGRQLIDGMRAHNSQLSKQALQERAIDVLQRVDLDPAVARMYPHELSGGMKQRVCIAIAISLSPKVIIADEPTSALDVVIQRQVMETIANVQQELDASVILIGHDIGLMVQFVDRLIIMYAGKIAEIGTIEEIFSAPKHPYTQMLISSLPTLETKGVFKGIPGIAPSLLNAPPGCLFHPRCPQAFELCRQRTPQLEKMDSGQEAACHLY